MVKPIHRLAGRVIYGDLHLDFVEHNKGDDIICEMFYVDSGARFYEATITADPPEPDVEVVFKALLHAEYLQGLQTFEILSWQKPLD